MTATSNSPLRYQSVLIILIYLSASEPLTGILEGIESMRNMRS